MDAGSGAHMLDDTHLIAFNLATEGVRRLPAYFDNKKVTPAHAARVVARLLGGQWRVTDGFFCHPDQPHSWLEAWPAERRRAGGIIVLDVMPIGGLLPFLMFTGYGGPWMQIYVPAHIPPERRDALEREASQLTLDYVNLPEGSGDLLVALQAQLERQTQALEAESSNGRR